MSISEIGIFARTFTRRSAAEVAEAVRGAGFTLAQFNFSAIGLDTSSTPTALSEMRRPGTLSG